MALLWQRTLGETRYELRSAGATRRLYTNGVLHSQYNPRQPVSGNLWDLLLLPAFFPPAGEVRRVLVLGVGGGAVIRQLRHFIRPAEIIGVDIDAVHLSLARRFFGVRGAGVSLVQADAGDWLTAYRGAGFDLIIDDLFGGRDGLPERALPHRAAWCRRLLRHLAPRGVLVANFVSTAELKRSACCANAALRRRFASVFALKTAQNENTVGAFLRFPASSRQLRARLRGLPGLDPSAKSRRLHYRIRRIR